MAAVLFPIALVGARARTDARTFTAWMLLLEAACIGSFISLDLVLFFLFFELTLVPSYFIISGWGFARRAYAAVKFFVYTFLGSAFLLVGIVALAFVHQHETGVLDLLAARPRAHLAGVVDRDPLVPGLHGRLRGEGAAVPVPHLVTGRLHRGPARARSILPRCWPSSAPTASSASTSTCSPRRPGRWPRCS